MKRIVVAKRPVLARRIFALLPGIRARRIGVSQLSSLQYSDEYIYIVLEDMLEPDLEAIEQFLYQLQQRDVSLVSRVYILADDPNALIVFAHCILADGIKTPNLLQFHSNRVRPAGVRKIILSRRERDILLCIASGLTYAESSKELGLHVENFKEILRKLKIKMSARTKEGLVMAALRQGHID